MPALQTEIIIHAPAERVGELLADISLYLQWHPLFPQVTGKMEVGAPVEVTVALPGIKEFTLGATIREYTPGHCLCWRYSYPLPGLFIWTYRYQVKALENGEVTFIQDSIYSGLLAPLYHLGMKSPLQQGLCELNKAVQRWSERRGMSCLKC